MALKASGLAAVLATTVALLSPPDAAAHTSHRTGSSHHLHHAVSHQGRASRTAFRFREHRHVRYAGARVIQCVAFVRANSDIALAGNADDWWDNASGVYARGSTPSPGSVIAFRSTYRMPDGHVALVTDVLDRRTIVISQSHWGEAGVSRDVRVVDVSADNDWSDVRVELGHGGTYGSIYPTYGFIYPRPPTTAAVTLASADSRPRRAVTLEMAEAPPVVTPVLAVASRAAGGGIDLSTGTLTDDAPDRGLR